MLFFFSSELGVSCIRAAAAAGVSSTVGRYSTGWVVTGFGLRVFGGGGLFTTIHIHKTRNVLQFYSRLQPRAGGRADDVLTAATAALSWPLSRAAFWGRLRVRRLEGQVLRGRVCCAWQVVSSLNGPRPVSCSALLARERACRWIVT